MPFERKAYHSPRAVSLDIFKAKFNQAMALEIKYNFFRFKNESYFWQKIIAYKGILCEKIREGEYRFKVILT